MEKALNTLAMMAKKDKKILAAMAFGSYARKEKYRDIDVALVLYPGKHTSLEMTNIRIKYSGISDKLDVHVFQQLPIYIRERILKEGKTVFCIDEDILYEVVFTAIREVSDFMPKYRRFLGVEA